MSSTSGVDPVSNPKASGLAGARVDTAFGINFDARYDSRLGDGLNEGSAIFLLLADGLVIEDYATNALSETGVVTINSRYVRRASSV
jgi:hypothetical protein